MGVTKKKRRYSEGEHLPDHANMAKEIFGLTEDRIMTLPKIASKVLNLPETVKTKSKQPSKKLQQIVTKIGSMFMTLEDSINEALELGRKEGFTDIEIGDMIRAEFKRINRPRMTLARYLPVTAKHMEKARPKSDFGNKMLPNKPVAISTENVTLPSTDTTTLVATKSEQQQRPGKWNQGPEEFEIERLYEYDLDYCRTTIQWLYEDNMKLKRENTELKAAAVAAVRDSTASAISKPKPKPGLKPHESPRGKMDLDSWQVTLGPSGKEDPSGRLFEHTYKRYKKSGWLSEVLRVDDDGKVEVDQITTGAYSLDSLPHRELSTEELQPRRNYWKIHAAPMDKIEQARKRAEELKKTQEEYEEKKSKLTPEEREALQKYETDMLMSGFTSLMKRDD